MATKKTPAKKAAAKKAPAKATAETTTEAEVISLKKEATEITDEALALDPIQFEDETGDVVESAVAAVPDVTVEVEDPVINTIDILSATGLNTPRDAVAYQQSFVESYPNIDDLVDRKTERTALLGYQAYMRGGDRALERFLYDHWGLPQPKAPVGAHAFPSPPSTSSNPRGEAGRRARQRAVDQPERWVPKVPPLAGPQGSVDPPTTPMGSLQTMEEAFDEARKGGDFL